MSTKNQNSAVADKPVKKLSLKEDNTQKGSETPGNTTEESSEVQERPQPNGSVPNVFTVTKEQLEEIADCINSVVGNKYAKQTIFNCLNANITPVK